MANKAPSKTALTITQFQQIVAGLPVDSRHGTQAWREALYQNTPDWKTIVINPANHQALLQCYPKYDRQGLITLFVETVGLDLANAWIDHQDPHAAFAAKCWLYQAIDNAIEHNNFEQIQLFNKKDDLSEELFSMMHDALIKAALKPNIKACKWLLSHGASVCSRDSSGATPLMHIAQSGDRSNVSKNIARLFKKSINYQDENGKTALMYAAVSVSSAYNIYKGNLNFAFMLIDIGANTLKTDKFERTALWWANRCNIGESKKRNKGMINLLKKHMIIQKSLIRCGQDFEFDSNGYIITTDCDYSSVPGSIINWLKEKQNLLSPNAELPALPKIHLSNDDPPLFSIYSDLKIKHEDDIISSFDVFEEENEKENHNNENKCYLNLEEEAKYIISQASKMRNDDLAIYNDQQLDFSNENQESPEWSPRNPEKNRKNYETHSSSDQSKSEEETKLRKYQKWKKEFTPDSSEIEIETVDTESLLGCYLPYEKKIILWRKGIDLCAKWLKHDHGVGLPIKDVIRCVLVHELGHWFNAEAITAGNITWDQSSLTIIKKQHKNIAQSASNIQTGNAYSLSSMDYHEAWAQFFAWLYGQERDTGVLKAFEAIERGQSKAYQAWRNFVNASPNPGPDSYTLSDLRWPQHHILASLEWSRSLRDLATNEAKPATFNDDNSPDTNMLAWL